MTTVLTKLWVVLGSILIMGGIFYSCGDDTTTTSSSRNYSYNGPGSVWNYVRSDSTVTITCKENASDTSALMTVTATASDLASGFVKLTVTEASGSTCGGIAVPSVNATAYNLEAPGYASLVKPFSGDQILPMVSSGGCPTADIEANWVMVKNSSGTANATDYEYFGQFAFSVSNGTGTLPSRNNLVNFNSTGAQNLNSGTCSEGVLSIDSATMYLTTTGGAIVHIEDDNSNQFIFGFDDPTITAATAAGEYSGWLFDDNSDSGEKIFPIYTNLAVSGSELSGTAQLFSDIDADTRASEDTVTITLNAFDSPTTGMMTGTIASASGGSGNLACIGDVSLTSSSKKIISCVGQSPGDTSKMFNVLLVNR